MFNGTIYLDRATFTQAEIDAEKHRIVITPEGAQAVFKKMVNEGKSTYDSIGAVSVPTEAFIAALYDKEVGRWVGRWVGR